MNHLAVQAWPGFAYLPMHFAVGCLVEWSMFLFTRHVRKCYSTPVVPRALKQRQPLTKRIRGQAGKAGQLEGKSWEEDILGGEEAFTFSLKDSSIDAGKVWPFSQMSRSFLIFSYI